jgi:heme/copper-type cytochrome/quinol oxidase subunit 2
MIVGYVGRVTPAAPMRGSTVRRRSLLVAPALLATLLTGCAGKDVTGTATTSAPAPGTSTAATTSAPTPAATGTTPPPVSASPSPSPSPSVATSAAPRRVQFSIANGKIAGPAKIDMKVGQTIELQVATDKAATVHAHGFNVEKDLKPGDTASVFLTAKQPGSFDVEEHVTGKLITRVQVTA